MLQQRSQSAQTARQETPLPTHALPSRAAHHDAPSPSNPTQTLRRKTRLRTGVAADGLVASAYPSQAPDSGVRPQRPTGHNHLSAPSRQSNLGISRKPVISRQDIGTYTSDCLVNQGRRPYLSAVQLKNVRKGSRFVPISKEDLRKHVIIHLDLNQGERQEIYRTACRLTPPHKASAVTQQEQEHELRRMFSNDSSLPSKMAAAVKLPNRTPEDVQHYLRDISLRKTSREATSLWIGSTTQPSETKASNQLHQLLFAREVAGFGGFSYLRQPRELKSEFKGCCEAELDVRVEWTNCAGDVWTISWVSNDAFLCGTTNHSDSHNERFNKPGNLVLGSCSTGVLQAYPDHRIARPIVPNLGYADGGAHQDPWLYTSVCSSDHDTIHNLAFTASWDRTAKVWKMHEQLPGIRMEMVGEWKHEGNVNFVAVSRHPAGCVATAADVPVSAVRIYQPNEGNMSDSPFYSVSCSRITDADGNLVYTDKWAYFPATMRWGLAEKVAHLLLVGYSPRSLTGDDNDIPEDRRDTGELCLWDGITGEKWRITSSTSLNIFEVLWHPSQNCFIAATSRGNLGLDKPEGGTRTQIRLFKPALAHVSGDKAYSSVRVLDCAALDINDLTIMPNSLDAAYVTAACTDGNVYVWDTGLNLDSPIHVISHGKPIADFTSSDRERDDSGVKFTAWGGSLNHLYTGSSDGVVKLWNIRSLDQPVGRTILEAPAPVTCGAFSPDRSKLIIGDASGRVFLLSMHELEQETHDRLQAAGPKLPPGFVRRTKHPRPPVTPHAQPPEPTHDADGAPYERDSGIEPARSYLARGHIRLASHPLVGAVQGPNYAEIGFYEKTSHQDDDPTRPLLAEVARLQQDQYIKARSFPPLIPRLRPVVKPARLLEQHRRNEGLNLNLASLDVDTARSLRRERVEVDGSMDYALDYDES